MSWRVRIESQPLPGDGQLFPNLVREGLPTNRELSRHARIEMSNTATSTRSFK
jgi:hypothetical protein